MATLLWQATAGEAWTVRARARDFLSGQIVLSDETVAGEQGWTRPLRFTTEQIRALSSVAAWHPALYRSQATSCAGVCVEVRTTADHLALEVSRDLGNARVGDETAALAEDGFSLDIDGRHVPEVLDAHGTGFVVVDLSGEKRAKAPRVVRIWLPAYSGCSVRAILASADLEALPERRTLLVLGGSIAQGQSAHDPGLGWAQTLRRTADLEVINQGLLSQIFQPSALSPLAGVVDPDLVWVAYGGTYRHEECYESSVERDVRAALGVIRRLWRDRPTWIATPTPHDESARPSSAKSCWREVPMILEHIADRWPQFELVDGDDLLDADPELFEDADHPNAAGHELMATRIARVLAGKPAITDREREDRALPAFLREMERRRPVAPEAPEKPDAADAEAAELVEEAVAEGEDASEPTPAAARPSPSSHAGGDAGEADDEDITDVEVEFVEVEAEVAEATTVLDARSIRAAMRRTGEADASAKGAAPAPARPASARTTGRAMGADVDAVIERLAAGPLDSVPMEQILRRGLGKLSYAGEGFCSVDLADGTRYFFGDDVVEAKRAMGRQTRPSLAVILSPELESVVRRVFPTNEVSLAYKLAVWEGTDPLPIEAQLDIRRLGASWATTIRRSYSFPEGASAAEIAHLLAKGRILGGFDLDNQLVGFIGEHPDGALGMLEVFPRARRRGYGSALLAAKANEHLAQGWTPFSQVMSANEVSLALHEALGFTIVPTRQLYIPMEG